MNKADFYIDVHTHKNQINKHIAVLNIDTSENSIDLEILRQPNKHPNLYFSAGIHPWFTENWTDMLNALKEIIPKPEIIAIGECGLDKKIATPLNEQIEIFLTQIALSEKYKKPLIIHCVKAFNELLEIRKSSKSTMPWIVHGYTGNLTIARLCVNAGMWLSFGKSLFDLRSKSAFVIKSIPAETFFLETDDGDYNIADIYAKCAEITGIPLIELTSSIATNFQLVFKPE